MQRRLLLAHFAHGPGHFWKRRKNQAPAYIVSDKGQYDRLKPKWCFNAISWILLGGTIHPKPTP